MSATFRTVLASSLTAVMLALAMTPVEARPNNGSFNRSSEGFKQAHLENCAAQKRYLAEQEKLAEKLAEQGKKKESKAASESADAMFEYARKKGCAWAQ